MTQHPLVPILKMKRDSLSPNSSRGIKKLQHDFKFYKKVLDGQLHTLVDPHKMQYEFMLGEKTTDAVFTLRRHAEKFQSKNEKMCNDVVSVIV